MSDVAQQHLTAEDKREGEQAPATPPSDAEQVAVRNPEAFAALATEGQAEAVEVRNPVAFAELHQVPAQTASADSTAHERRVMPVPNKGAKRGRPLAQGPRRFRSLREKLRAYETALDRYERQRRSVDLQDMEAKRLEAVSFALRPWDEESGNVELLAQLPAGLLNWGVSAGIVPAEARAALSQGGTAPTTRPATPPAPAASPPPAVAGAAQAATGAPATATGQATTPTPPTPPAEPMAMGVPVAKLKRYAVPAAVVAQVACAVAKRPSFDPSVPLDLVYGRGTLWEFKVEGMPAERLGELLAAEMAQSLAPKADAGSPTARRFELVALGAVMLGPAVLEKAGQLATVGKALVQGVKAKLRARRGAAQ